MTVNLYKTTDDPRVVNKTLTTVGNSISATAKGSFSILTPTLILDYVGSMAGVNYFYISDFGRYYYITDISLDIGGRIVISGTIDVLKTYSAPIRQCKATVVRSESIGAPTMIPDNKLPINPNKKELKTAVYQFKGSAATDVHTPRYFLKIKYSPTAYIPKS